MRGFLLSRLRERAARSRNNPAISRSPANPNGSAWSEPVTANDEFVGVPTGVGVASGVGVGVGVGVIAGATGVTALEAAEETLVPTVLVAVTVNVYLSPLLRPVTVMGEPVPVAVCPPLPGVVVSVAVTVYPVTAEPPSLAGGVKATLACPAPAVAATPVGAPGAVAGTTGMTAAVAAEAAPTPMAFVAVTVNV